mgnify:CR=1 FL=1
MEEGCGIYRSAELMQATCTKLGELRGRYHHLQLDDTSRGWNTEWLLALELGFQLEVAEAEALCDPTGLGSFGVFEWRLG